MVSAGTLTQVLGMWKGDFNPDLPLTPKGSQDEVWAASYGCDSQVKTHEGRVFGGIPCFQFGNRRILQS